MLVKIDSAAIPPSGFDGDDSFGYVFSDGATHASATVHVRVRPGLSADHRTLS